LGVGFVGGDDLTGVLHLHHIGDIMVPADPGPAGKWPLTWRETRWGMSLCLLAAVVHLFVQQQDIAKTPWMDLNENF